MSNYKEDYIRYRNEKSEQAFKKFDFVISFQKADFASFFRV